LDARGCGIVRTLQLLLRLLPEGQHLARNGLRHPRLKRCLQAGCSEG
jgi:hypothetical protein